MVDGGFDFFLLDIVVVGLNYVDNNSVMLLLILLDEILLIGSYSYKIIY